MIMRVEDCYQLGYVSKTHGLQGEVNIILDVDFPEHYEEMESVFLQPYGAGTLVPFFIENFRTHKDGAIVKFEDVDSLEQATTLVKAILYLPLNQLPPLGKGQYYYHEIIRFRIVDEHHGTLGEIQEVYEAGNQYLIAMEYRQQEILIPLNDNIVIEVDKEKKTVSTRLPEGLLDIYLE